MTPSEADAAIVRETCRDLHEDTPRDMVREEERDRVLLDALVRCYPTLDAQNA